MNLIPDQALALEPPLERGFEWVRGQAVEKPVGVISSRVGTRLSGLLDQHAVAHDLGFALNAECGYQIFPEEPKKVRKPDVSFIPRGRLPNDQLPGGNARVVPDLVAEVVSPNYLANEIEERIHDFLEVGTRLAWVVYPSTRSVWVVRADGTGARLTGSRELDGENVVPGFRVPLTSLFVNL